MRIQCKYETPPCLHDKGKVAKMRCESGGKYRKAKFFVLREEFVSILYGDPCINNKKREILSVSDQVDYSVTT